MHVVASADKAMADLLREVVEERGTSVHVTGEAGDVIRLWSGSDPPEVILIDQVLNGIDGEQLASLLSRGTPTRVVLISATLAEGGASTAPADVIVGRAGGEELKELVREALRVPITSEEPVILRPQNMRPRSVTQHLVRHWQRVSRIVDQLREGVAIAEPDGTILFANPAMFHLLGVDAHKLIGHEIASVLNEYDQDEVRHQVLRGNGMCYGSAGENNFLNFNVQAMNGDGRLRIVFCEPANDAIHAQIATDMIDEVSDHLIELSLRLSELNGSSGDESTVGTVLTGFLAETFPLHRYTLIPIGDQEPESPWRIGKTLSLSVAGEDTLPVDAALGKLVELTRRFLASRR